VIHREVAREIDALLRVIFTARHKTPVIDLEAVEMALRAALQQAGAAGLSQLLRQESPAESQGPCSCGGLAGYKGMRRNAARLLLVLPLLARGMPHRRGALDVKNTELSPGVRRILTLVSSECSLFRARPRAR